MICSALHCIGAALALHWCCIVAAFGPALALYWPCIGDALVLFCHFRISQNLFAAVSAAQIAILFHITGYHVLIALVF